MQGLRICSFFMDNIPAEIRERQASVFAHLRLPLEQCRFEEDGAVGGPAHGAAIDRVMQDNDAEHVILFDIDCIPLCREIIEDCYLPAMRRDVLLGPAQRAGRISERIYAGPSALGVSRRLYETLGRPSFRPTPRGDVGAELTWLCEERGHPVIRLPVTGCAVPMWPLRGTAPEFGWGTTYAGTIYHAYEIRTLRTRDMFLKKCAEVLERPV